MTVYCSNCGIPDDKGSKFCRNCGTALDQNQEDPVQASQDSNTQPLAQPVAQSLSRPVGAYQSQTYSQPIQGPADGVRTTGLTFLALIIGLFGVIGAIGLPQSFAGGIIPGSLALISVSLSLGIFYAIWYMKEWGVKFVIGARVAAAGISLYDLYVLSPPLLRQTLIDQGWEGTELDVLYAAAFSFAQTIVFAGIVISLIIIAYVYSKRELFVN